jgi:hypothetical protein
VLKGEREKADVGKQVYHTGSRERGGGLQQTLDQQAPYRAWLTVGRKDATGTASNVAG